MPGRIFCRGADIGQPQADQNRERADSGDRGLRSERGNIQSQRDKAGGQQRQAEHIAQHQSVVERCAECQGVEHQRHAGHQRKHEYQQTEEFAQHDMVTRQGRRKQQCECLAATFFSDQTHREYRHQHHQQ